MDESAVHIFTVAFSVLKGAFWLALPFAALSFTLGLVTGVIQTGTSVQDQSISNMPKLVAIGILLFVIGSYVMNSLIIMTTNLFGDFSLYIGN